eukprot:Seg5660.1 transcript_id=Seg5660.1/GoldUCD/mRNA.D3Y31 product="hypothetical protein" protein_id=Seg5660.1/GoldUCD/D3Y31
MAILGKSSLVLLAVMFVACFFQVEAKIKVCDDPLGASCKFLVKHKACKSHKRQMRVYCPKSCEFCKITEKTANPCDKLKCGFAEDCFWRLDGTARCKCNLTCNALEKRSGPVCARGGKTYADLCTMKMDQCKVKKEITVYHYGHCIQQDNCMDVLPDLCKKLHKNGICKVKLELMQFYCPRTCRMCRQPAPPPSCLTSKYGCCWNTNKPATGPNQRGCKACSEAKFCKQFVALCSQERNMAIMRQLCPKSCHYC